MGKRNKVITIKPGKHAVDEFTIDLGEGAAGYLQVLAKAFEKEGCTAELDGLTLKVKRPPEGSVEH